MIAFAFAAAVVLALLVVGAALASRIAPRAAPVRVVSRRAPEGWVAETRAR